ncbi:MAG: putative metal-dependent HD superfamily phosphohydrolase [Saprospiraceae bacterium]|jgi:predicted metal-dependent HD superfamily phosphohydrolase
MQVENSLLLEVEAYVSNFISEQVPKEYAYHDVQHTISVVSDAKEMSEMFELSERDQEILLLASWFHDTGYDKGALNHEDRGAMYARNYLSSQGYNEEDLRHIEACILVTKMPHQPTTLLERIICDADLAHVGQKIYWERCSKVRQEMALTRKVIMTDQEWVDFELGFMNNHKFHTPVAQQLFNERKEKHIRQLYKQKVRLNPHAAYTVDGISNMEKPAKKKKKKKKSPKSEIKEPVLSRGVETMYRTTYRTHINLSSIADNKANIMLSINAIVISITLSILTPRFAENPKLIFPTMILLSVCLLAVIFATLSTRPKITEGIITPEDIKAKRSNLLFFGNFYNMKMDDFEWGMMEMIKDPDFIYSSMTRDLFFLGVVLAKKYRYLRICYGIFMYGLIVAVLTFAVAFML